LATAPEIAEREYSYLKDRSGAAFFVQIGPSLEHLDKSRPLRKSIRDLEKDVADAASRYAEIQNSFVEEAKAIRAELATRAPEIDNSDMKAPDPGSHAWALYDMESLARFDELAAGDADVRIGFPPLPRHDDDPGTIGQLLIILRGRLRCAA
jgi:hypothetical protein